MVEKGPEYATFLAQGWDTIQDAVCCRFRSNFISQLEHAKSLAADRKDATEAPEPIRIGNEIFQVKGYGGKKGVRYILENDDLHLRFRTAGRDWSVTVRYLAAGLWEYGYPALEKRVSAALATGGGIKLGEPVKVSRADWAWDFWSPAFTAEMVPEIARQVVCHSSVKIKDVGDPEAPIKRGRVGRSGNTETLDIGLTKTSLQISVYDKTKEITEASGKTWMYDLWAREGYAPPDGEESDVWRLEVRMGRDYLRERRIITHTDLDLYLPELLSEALITRRLTVPKGGDSNRRRWPLHPLWTAAYKRTNTSGHMLPLGKMVTGRRDELLDQGLLRLAGALRSLTVLSRGRYLPDEAQELTQIMLERITADPGHGNKEQAAVERYRFVDDAA